LFDKGVFENFSQINKEPTFQRELDERRERPSISMGIIREKNKGGWGDEGWDTEGGDFAEVDCIARLAVKAKKRKGLYHPWRKWDRNKVCYYR